MVARFLGCVVVTHQLPHTPVQIFSRLILVHKKFWCCLFSLSIQIEVFAVTFHITLVAKKYSVHFDHYNLSKKEE